MFRNGNHWALFFIDMSLKTIFYIDTDPAISQLHRTEKKISILNNWKKFCKNRNVMKEYKWSINDSTYQLQNDSFNCGVFVCYYFDLLIKRKDYDLKNTVDNISLFRKVIFQKIVKICQK